MEKQTNESVRFLFNTKTSMYLFNLRIKLWFVYKFGFGQGSNLILPYFHNIKNIYLTIYILIVVHPNERYCHYTFLNNDIRPTNDSEVSLETEAFRKKIKRKLTM